MRRPLLCPACAQPLEPRYARVTDKPPVLVHRCNKCHGVLMEKAAVAELGAGFAVTKEVLEVGIVSCPRCMRLMHELDVKAAKWGLFLLVVDKCPGCESLFFEAGEVERATGRDVKLASKKTDEALMSEDEIEAEIGDLISVLNKT